MRIVSWNLAGRIRRQPEQAEVVLALEAAGLTHEALYAYARERDRIVLEGDLNTPRRTHEDGTVLTFAHDTKGRLRDERGERWAAAERALVLSRSLG